ncbi:MAG: DUF2071 domain-containing protein [Ferruginibacter sp.]
MKKTFLTAEWRKLIIINYEVDQSILKPYLPYKTEIDTWNGKCYISLIGFQFSNTKLKGLRIPFHSDFEEINIRFYVKFKKGNEWKRGVTFIKEIVPKHAITFVANTIYSEKYKTYPTRHQWNINNDFLEIAYSWKHNDAWDSIKVKTRATPVEILSGSEEEFITQHFWGYTKVNDNKTSEYQVEHPVWKMYPVLNHEIQVRFEKIYGEEFSFLQDSKPVSVMLAEGSSIAVRAAGNIL